MRIILLLFSFLLSSYSFSQDIVGSWKYKGLEPVIKTNKEESTKKLEERVNQDKPNTSLIFQFTSSGEFFTNGKEKRSYHVQDSILHITGDTFKYNITENILTLIFDLHNLDPGMLKRYEDEEPDLKIEKCIVNMYFEKVPEDFIYQDSDN